MLFILNTDFKTIQIKGCYLQPLNVGFNGLKIYRAKILILAEDGRYSSDRIFYNGLSKLFGQNFNRNRIFALSMPSIALAIAFNAEIMTVYRSTFAYSDMRKNHFPPVLGTFRGIKQC